MSGVLSVELPSGETLTCGAPSLEMWDDYIEKSSRGDSRAGQKQLIMKSCTSHDPEACREILAKWPAMVDPVALALDGMCGSDLEYEVDHAARTFSLEVDGDTLTFEAPNEHRFEQLQANMEDPKIPNGKAVRDLLRELCDNKPAFDAVSNKYPTCTAPALPIISELAGARLKISVKKD